MLPICIDISHNGKENLDIKYSFKDNTNSQHVNIKNEKIMNYVLMKKIVFDIKVNCVRRMTLFTIFSDALLMSSLIEDS